MSTRAKKPLISSNLEWLGESSFVKEGQPVILFHGSAVSCLHSLRVSDGNLMRGIYLTDSKVEAAEWGARNDMPSTVYSVLARIVRPAEASDVQEVLDSYAKRGATPTPAQMTASLKRKGFDGYCDESNAGPCLEIVAFKADQVRIVH